MDWPLVVLIIVVIGAVTSTLHAIIDRPPRKVAGLEDGEAQRLRDEVRVLRERVVVLERIATDRDHRLELEFDRLRDS